MTSCLKNGIQVWHEVRMVNSLTSKHGVRRISTTNFQNVILNNLIH
jgi:hypothetical protein